MKLALTWQVCQWSTYGFSAPNPPSLTYSLRIEKGPVNISLFHLAGYYAQRGKGRIPEEEGFLSCSGLLSSPDSFAVCGLWTARPLQHTAANSSWGLTAPPHAASQ